MSVLQQGCVEEKSMEHWAFKSETSTRFLIFILAIFSLNSPFELTSQRTEHTFPSRKRGFPESWSCFDRRCHSRGCSDSLPVCTKAVLAIYGKPQTNLSSSLRKWAKTRPVQTFSWWKKIEKTHSSRREKSPSQNSTQTSLFCVSDFWFFDFSPRVFEIFFLFNFFPMHFTVKFQY